MSTEEDSSTLKRKAVRGGVFAMASRLATIIIQIASIIALSRLLSPDDFGIIAMVTAVTAFMGLFRDMGLSTASIQRVDLSFEHTNALFWLNVLAGSLLMLIMMAAAPLVSWFYGRAELTGVTVLLATTFLVSSVGAQHAALMQRDLRIAPKALADISGAAITLLVSVSLALLDYGFWSLAWGTVLGAVVTTALYFKGSSFIPGRPARVGGMRELIGFGANVTAFEIVNYFHRNLDRVLIGKVWGADVLGNYSRAYQMMMLPISSIRAPINSIALPVLSRLKDSPKEFRQYYSRIASLLAFLSMPLMAFLVVNSEDVITIALGSQWHSVAPIFALLGITGFIQPVASLRGLVLLSLGRTSQYLHWGLLNAAVASISFFVGVQWGPTGVALAYAIANYLLLYPSLRYFFRETPLYTRDFFSSIAIPGIASLVAAAAVVAISRNVGGMPDSPLIRLSIAGTAFSIVFFLSVVLLPGGTKTLKSFHSLARMIR